MLTQLKKRTQGFTIIEVMIVLAIAGLIILIVFLAVPALQRNSRNTQRRNDVSKAFGAVQEYANNNNGALPTGTGDFNTQFTSATVSLGFYTAANFDWNYSAAARTGAVPGAPANTDAAVLYNYMKCADPNTGTFTGASNRSVVALFRVESSGGSTTQCQES